MIIGVPRERKAGECRVAITPEGVLLLVSSGHSVIIEEGAGKLSSFTDQEFIGAGAKISPSLEEVWTTAELLVKVKEPAPEELQFFRSNLTVFSFLHPAVAPEMMKALIEKGVLGLDYDLLMLEDGRLPILEPMSVIAGKLSIQAGAFALQANSGGRGLLLGGAVGAPPARVVVVGAGAAGSNAARVALGMGAEVVILDIREDRLAPFAAEATIVKSTPEALSREIQAADLVIGSVLIPGALAPKLLTRTILDGMKPGSVIVDICIDQGGFAESSRATTIAEPTYVDSNVVHYCVPNMPALVPRTSTSALTSATLPWVKMIAERGLDRVLRESHPVRHSVVSMKGKLTNKAIGDALGLASVKIESVL